MPPAVLIFLRRVCEFFKPWTVFVFTVVNFVLYSLILSPSDTAITSKHYKSSFLLRVQQCRLDECGSSSRFSPHCSTVIWSNKFFADK